MNRKKKLLCSILCIGGLVLIFLSMYINAQVLQGQEQVDSAKGKVGGLQKIFSLTPQTNQIGQGVTRSANRKIAEGQNEVNDYRQLATILRIAGIACVIVGAGLFFLNRRKTRS